MIFSLMYEGKLYQLSKELKYEGGFYLAVNGRKELISIIGEDDHWVLKTNKKVKVKEDENIKSLVLEENKVYSLLIEEKEAFLYCEILSEEYGVFKKYLVEEDLEITIGSDEDNVLSFSKDFITKHHAILTYRNKYWQVEDLNSEFGVYVNNERIIKKDLDFGDIIYIMGLQIVVGYDFLALNTSCDSLKINNKNIKPMPEELYEDVESDEEYEIESKEDFSRSPYFKKKIKTARFKIDSPPNCETLEKLPAILSFGPMFTMGLASLTTAAFSINSAIISGNVQSYAPTIIMSISMLLGSLLWPLVTKVYDNKRRNKNEKKRVEKYLLYLEEMQQKINAEILNQEKILKDNFVSIDECEDRILNTKRTLWERNIFDSDFLQLRLGVGDYPLNYELNYLEKSFTLEQDILLDKMYELCEQPKILKNVPITHSFYDNYITGVIGDKQRIFDFAKGLIFQISAFYSYDEVKMIFIYDENDLEFDFVKWLPHVFSNDQKFRFIATNLDELKELSYYLSIDLDNRNNMNDNIKDDYLPYYVVFVLDRKLGLKSEILEQLYNKKKNINISIINFCENLQDLPKECSAVLEVEENKIKIHDHLSILDQQTFKIDIYPTADPFEISKKLANTPLKTISKNYQLPGLVKFLQLFKVGKVKHLNILKRWNDSDPTKSLATPIGLDTYGELFNLDLHEKFHGPHGLVAGMTGSGKSEFIMTYILSLALNYHPHEVSFILIDYKGGTMAKSFEALPHTAGIITNLDGSAIKRAIVAINSELKRRQRIFDEASRKVQVSNIDIYKYQKLYREKKVMIPLPHLFIISDEFAELKQQKPEFMNELVSIARIGRSLGIHLILATQKPSGVVDDQIWSNSKFRICLKVQEKSDSMDMLKRADAALLKEAGRFYLQVGYNELFELGQAAWAGATYFPQEKYMEEKDDSVVFIDKNSHILKEVKLNKKQKVGVIYSNQLEAITKHISDIALSEKIKSLPIWLKPLEDIILLKDILKKYKLTGDQKYKLAPVIGEYDDPYNQLQNYLRLEISQKGNVAIYGNNGSGKTLLLTTMIYSLITTHTPEELNIYILDFDTAFLVSFEDAPQIGEIILSSDQEKVKNLIKILYKELEQRKKKFAKYGGNYSTYIEESKESVAQILVVIHNYAVYLELYPETEDDLNYLMREGKKFGLYFVISATTSNIIKYKISQHIGENVVLNFHDDANYSLILGKTDGLIPKQNEGRGLIKKDKNVYEFQTARVFKEVNSYEFIKEECQKLSISHNGKKASKIAVLPDHIKSSDLLEYVSDKLNVPIGIEKNSLNISYYFIEENYINFGFSTDLNYISFVNVLANFIQNNYIDYKLHVIDPSISMNDLNPNIKYYTSNNELEGIADYIYNLVLERNNKYKEAKEQNIKCEEFKKEVFIINSYSNLINELDEVSIEKLDLALEKGCIDYNVYFVIFDIVKKSSLMRSKKWYNEQFSKQEGLWFGDSFEEQYIFDIKTQDKEIKTINDHDMIISIKNSVAKLVKVMKEDGDNNE